MNILALIILLIIITIAFFLGFLLYRAYGKIKSLEVIKYNLIQERAKLSDALRVKGIEIDGLNKKIKRLEEGK